MAGMELPEHLKGKDPKQNDQKSIDVSEQVQQEPVDDSKTEDTNDSE